MSKYEACCAHKDDAGIDLCSEIYKAIAPLQTIRLRLPYKVNLKKDECGIIIARSSIASKGLLIHNSPIDCGYRGYVHAIVTNLSNKTIEIEEGERFCQLVIFKIGKHGNNNLLTTLDRLDAGFGSSGKKGG